MQTILLTNKYSSAALDIVREELPEGFEIKFLSSQSSEALEREVCEADYLLAGGRLEITEKVLKNAGRLKMLQRSGVGLDALDLEAIKAAGLPLYVNQGVNAQSVAEHTLLLMLACLRRLTEINDNTHSGIWKKQEQGVKTSELHGKTVGLIGMGNIARTLVGMLRPFGVKIIYFDEYRPPESFEKENGISYAGLEELFSQADLISLHCPLTDKTRGLINKAAISKMKDGVILVNTARGGIIEAQALAEALVSGKVSFAGIDVHEEEPISANYPLKSIKNVILTPHIAGVTGDSFRAMMRAAFRNIALFEKGEYERIAEYRYI